MRKGCRHRRSHTTPLRTGSETPPSPMSSTSSPPLPRGVDGLLCQQFTDFESTRVNSVERGKRKTTTGRTSVEDLLRRGEETQGSVVVVSCVGESGPLSRTRTSRLRPVLTCSRTKGHESYSRRGRIRHTDRGSERTNVILRSLPTHPPPHPLLVVSQIGDR